MKRIACFVFRNALRLLPPAFRRSYADEMLEVFESRLALTRGFAAVRLTAVEAGDVVRTAARVALGSAASTQPALVGGFALALLATMLTLQQTAIPTHDLSAPATDSVDFSAIDPAGEFTLTIRAGRPVAATVDRVPLPTERVVQQGDSIRLLDPQGSVILSLAYDRGAARIAWEPRPHVCHEESGPCAAL